MTTKIVFKEQIRAEVLRVLSGYCFQERRWDFPKIFILSPWISDVQLEFNKEQLPNLDYLWFFQDYGIFSINLPYALLLLKLDFDADINIVTLPPTEKHHHERASHVKNLLDFLDEIGCKVFVNPNLHAKLVLSNDIALIGSFNLSIPALWGREEVGVSIDDMENLRILEKYAYNVCASSRVYGYSLHAIKQKSAQDSCLGSAVSNAVNKGASFEEIERIVLKPLNSVTRGWLIEEIIERIGSEPHIFLSNHFRTVSTLDMAKEVTSDLEAFYVKVVLSYLESKRESDKQRLMYLRRRFGYEGKHEIGEILGFLETKLAREHVPKIPAHVVPMPEVE